MSVVLDLLNCGKAYVGKARLKTRVLKKVFELRERQ
jgi:hypothetical protein